MQIQKQVRLRKVKKELAAGVGEDAVTDEMWAVAAQETTADTLHKALEAGESARQELGVCEREGEGGERLYFCFFTRTAELNR